MQRVLSDTQIRCELNDDSVCDEETTNNCKPGSRCTQNMTDAELYHCKADVETNTRCGITESGKNATGTPSDCADKEEVCS